MYIYNLGQPNNEQSAPFFEDNYIIGFIPV